MDGVVRLAFAVHAGTTRLAELYQQAPLRAFFPSNGSDAELEAVLANVAGGLVGGDRLSTRISASDGARALVTTQAAEKVYRLTHKTTRSVTENLERFHFNTAISAIMEFVNKVAAEVPGIETQVPAGGVPAGGGPVGGGGVPVGGAAGGVWSEPPFFLKTKYRTTIITKTINPITI